MTGTGTIIGDSIEVNSLGRFIKSNRQSPVTQVRQECQYSDTLGQGHGEHQNEFVNEEIRDNTKTLATEETKCRWKHEPIYVGSVKTNIGHLEAAAGIAGLIKVLLMMKNGKIVRSLHVKQDKSNIKKTIKFEEYGLDVPLDIIFWNQNENGERISCVNSFGFGGSNSHAIVIQKTQSEKMSEESSERKIKIIALSASDKSSLQKSMVALQTDLSDDNFNLKDVSVTSLYFRDHLAFKTLLFGFDTLEIQTQIQNKVRKIDEIETPKSFRLIFVFCGVGTSWTGMCKEMMETETVFRNTVYRIDEILEPYTGFKLSDMFKENSHYSDPVLNHTAIFCTQVALFLLWQSWGVHPDAVIGQSVGEVAAAFASGALSLHDAVKVIYFRSKCLASITSGSMMVVGNVSHTMIQNLCKDQQNRVNIAVYNSPTSFTISGDADAMEKVKEILEVEKENNNKLLIKPLSVPCAYHSHHVEKCADILETHLSDLECRSKSVDIFSTVTGNIASGNEFQTGKYWSDNVQKPVQLMKAVSNASSSSTTNVFLEIGPKPVLRVHLRKIMSEINMRGMSLSSMDERKETTCIYSALSCLYELGADIQWENISPNNGTPVAIPRCIFNRTKRLLIPAKYRQLLHGIYSRSDSHMFVKMSEREKRTFLFTVSKKTTPFVYDHYFFGKILLPGATFIEAAFEVGQQISNLTCSECNISVNFVHTLFPESDKQNTVEMEVTKDTEDYSYHFVAKSDERILCYGTISRREDQEREHLDIHPILERCTAHKTRANCYSALQKFHFKYGKTMSPIQQAWSAETECLVELLLPESVISERKSTHLHPVILDGMLQGVASMTSFDSESSETYLPKSIGSVVINRQPTTRMFSYSHILKHDQAGSHFNCLLVSETGLVIAEIHDFFSSKISVQNATRPVSFYDIKWRGIDQSKYNHVSIQNKQIKDGIVVFGSKRFNDFYKKVDDSPAIFIDLSESAFDNESSFRRIFSPGKGSDIRSVIFAPCYNTEHIANKTGLGIFGKSRLLFLTFTKLLQTLMFYKNEIPVYVVTENVASPFQNTISSEPNVIGAELWGMVRSAMLEGRQSLCYLVDITLSVQNASILRNIVHQETLEIMELMIKDGFVYQPEISEEINESLEADKRREIKVDKSDNLALKSTNSAFLQHLYFDLHSGKAEISNTKIILCVDEVCLHNPALYPVSFDLEDTENSVWHEDYKNGYQVVCLEGTARKSDKLSLTKTKPDVGFCFPLDVTTYASVPSCCVFNLDDLPAYYPGMITVGVIIWNLLEACKASSNVCFVVEENCSDILQQIIQTIFIKRSQGEFSVETKERMTDVTNTNNAETIVILAAISHRHIEHVPVRYKQVETILSIEQYFPTYMKVWLEHNTDGMFVNVLKTENILSSFTLIEHVPEVVKTFMDADLKCAKHKSSEVTNKHETDLLSLPFPVFQMNGLNPNQCTVTLKVNEEKLFRKNGCYIVVGGLTGLGWEVLNILAELGAGYIATVSRRSPSKEKELKIEEIQKNFDCIILTLHADITDIVTLKNTLNTLQLKIGDAQIRGVFHGGGVVCDKLLRFMNEDEAMKPLLPKILGTWNLHECTLHCALDFFVMHSSIAAIFGNIGQTNYAAGNTFEDSFAHYRRKIGLCAQSINWGPLSVGMAVENKRLEATLENEGFLLLSHKDIKTCFVKALMLNQPQVMCARFDWSKVQHQPVAKLYPQKIKSILENNRKVILESRNTKQSFDFERYQKSDREGQETMISEMIKAIIKDVVVIDQSMVRNDTQLLNIGIDSMSATTLASLILETTNVRIPLGLLFEESTSVQTLVTYIKQNMSGDTNSEKEQLVDDEEKRFNKLLCGDVTFTQMLILEDIRKGYKSNNFLIQIDLELDGIASTRNNEFKVVMNHIMSINPDLRRIFTFNADGSYGSRILQSHEYTLDIEEVNYDSICNHDDVRSSNCFDITKDIPLKLQISTKGNKARWRFFIHKIVSDLSAITIMCKELAYCFEALRKNESFLVADSSIATTNILFNTLKSCRAEMKAFWKEQFNKSIKPFTHGSDIEKTLNEDDFQDIRKQVPPRLSERVFMYTKKRAIPLYAFITSAYMTVLHQKTQRELIPLIFTTDMRGYIPELRTCVSRLTNVIPIIGDYTSTGTAVEFMRRSSVELNLMIQHGAYPFQLIRDEVLPENLKMHIDRHGLIMDNMTHVSELIAQSDTKIKICNVFHNMAFKETLLMVEYDATQNNISFSFGYNAKALKTMEAEWIIQRMNDLLWSFMEYENESVQEIIQGNTAYADVLTAENKEHDLSTRMALPDIECLSTESAQAKCSVRELLREGKPNYFVFSRH